MRQETRQKTVTVSLNGGFRLIVRKSAGEPLEIILHEEHDLGKKTVLTKEESDDMAWLFNHDSPD